MKLWRQGLAALALGAMTVSPFATDAAFAKKGQKNDKIKDNGEKKGQKNDKIKDNGERRAGPKGDGDHGLLVSLLAAASIIAGIVVLSNGDDSPTSP